MLPPLSGILYISVQLKVQAPENHNHFVSDAEKYVPTMLQVTRHEIFSWSYAGNNILFRA